MADFFGFSKEVKGPGSIASSSAVLVSVGGGKVNLAQSVQIEYSRTIEPHYELGDDNVYFTVAPASGTCDITRLVGEGAMLSPFKSSNNCGLETVQVASSGNGCGGDIGVVTMRGLAQKVTVSANVQGFTVTDGATYSIGELDIS